MSCDILLTGANGQLGWEVQRRAAHHGLTVRGFTRAELDITDRDVVLRAVATAQPRLVVNAAAYTAVDKAEAERDLAFAVNRDGPRYLAEASKAANALLIHVSTDYVFDGQKPDAYRESDPVAPLGVYGASKLAGEDAVRETNPRHAIVRTAWVYGAHGNNFVKTMLRLGRERDVLRVVDDQHGCPTSAADLAEAVLTLAQRLLAAPPPEAFGTFHCVAAGQTTWCQFARKIFALTGARLPRTPRVDAITTAEYPTPARRPANSVLDCAKLSQTHGIAMRSWKDALAETLNDILTDSA